MGSEAVVRPKRRAIPQRIKYDVCERQNYCCTGCGARVHWKPRRNTHFDHEPALALRDVRVDGTDYIPPQHSARHIDARCPKCHHAKTHGTGATTAGTDVGKIKKERRRAKALAAAIELCDTASRQFIPPIRAQWLKQPSGRIRSRPFPPKGSRPMRGKR